MRRLSLVLTAVVLLAAAPARAQEKAPEPAPSPAPAEKAPENKGPAVSAGPEGFSLQNDGGDFRLQVRGYVQFDGRFFSGDEGALAVDTFLLRRVRPIVQGTLGRYFEFSVMPDFGGGSATIQDAWLDFKPSAKLKVRVGKFKAPVGLERLQPATATHFVERAFPTALVPNRDVGIEVYGDLAGGVVAYAAGILDGAPDGGSVDVDTNDGKDLAGRLFLSPFKRRSSVLKDLGFGIGSSTGKQTGPLPAYRSGGQISVITILTGIAADGTRKRYSPQLSFYSGPFGLLAEYARSSSRLKKADGTHFDLDASAWQIAGTIALTGDKASYAGVRPKKPFDPSKGQWGALEVAARVHELELDRGAVDAGAVDSTKSPRRITAWGAGLTWTLTRNVKQYVDFEHASFEGGSGGGDRESENAVLIRTQVSF